MKIGIDMDDVINNLVDVWLDCYNKDYLDNLSIEDIRGWDIDNYTKIGHDIYKYLGDEKLFKSLDIKDDASTIIEELLRNNEVYIVTANASYNKGVCDDKVNFVKKYLPFFPVKNIIFINNKSLMDLDILIDDGVHNLETFKGIKLLFDRPWNRDCDKFDRASDWIDVFNYIKELKWKKDQD
jgi:5'-nucleotidase